MNFALLQPQVRAYLLKHLHETAAAFALRKHPFNDLSTRALTQQLVGLQKASTKFPDFFANEHILYPPKVHLEQTSSLTTARYKAALVPGHNMVDLTGGFGIDVSAFAKAYSQTTHVELNEVLLQYANQLFKALKLPTKTYAMDAVQFLKQSTDVYDLIYLDPSRKTDVHPKAVRLEDYEPRVVDLLDLLFAKAPTLMIKTSPLLDLTAGMQALKKVRAVHIVAVKNEVKELLWILHKDATGDNAQVVATNLETTQPIVAATWPTTNGNSLCALPLRYLYEPNAAVMKSMAFGHICEHYNLAKLDQDTQLFTSDKLLDFPGRVFEIVNTIPYKPKEIKKRFSKSSKGVVVRNFRESVAQLRQKFHLAENESDYLFFTSTAGRYVVLEAVKIC